MSDNTAQAADAADSINDAELDQKSSFFAKGKLKSRPVVVDDTTYLVRELTAAELDRFQTEVTLFARAGVPARNVRSLLVRLGTIDSDGNHLFDDEDIDALAEMPGSFIDLFFEPISAMSGISDDPLTDLDISKN